MADVRDAAALAFYLAVGCAKILEPLLCFLGTPSPRSPAVDEAAAFLLLVLPTSYLAGVILAHFAGVVLAYLHRPAPAPVTAAVPFADLGRFVVMLFTLVSAWLVAVAVFLAAFFFFAAGKRGTAPWSSSCNVLV
jgi:hypothetical protein